MATVDEQIQLAEHIANEILQGLKKAAHKPNEERDLIKGSRNEWMKWLQVVEQHSLGQGIAYAQQLGKDTTLRSNIQTINKQIGAVVPKYKKRLEAFSLQQQREILGYVAWYLRIAAG